MKKILILLTVAATLTSCRHYPDAYDLSLKAIVVTNHDANANFPSHQTYYLPSEVGEIGDNPLDTILDSGIGQPILNCIRQNMNARGFIEDINPLTADIGIQVVAIKVTTVGTYYPGYWWGYGGYYYPYYPYYPYSYTYSYSTGSLIIDLIDIQNVDTVNNKVNVLWTNFNNGVLGNTSSTVLAVDAVNQAFIQSPYIKTN